MKNLIILIFLLGLAACSTKTTEQSQKNEATSALEQESVAEEVTAVCIWDQVSVRETPSSKGKWKTSISLGETLTSLGEKAIDTLDKDRSYIKVRLADGTEGWSVSDFIIEGGRVGVFLVTKDLYKRPDLLTKSDKQFSQMDIVAIKAEQDDWYEITGKRSEGKWIESGWVKQGEISENAIDVAVAKFAKKAMNEDINEGQIEGLQEILDNSDFGGSAFISIIEKRIIELQAPEETDETEVETDTASVD